MGDSQRAIGVGVQAVAGTPVAVTWLNYVEDFTHKPMLQFDVPKFKTNQRWMEKQIIAKTRHDEVTIKGRVDNVEFGLLLQSAFGPPTSGVYLAGSSPSKLLTVAWSEGLTALSWQMADARVTTLEFTIDASNGTVSYSATLRGVQALPQTTYTPSSAPSYTPDTGDLPFGAWQCVLKKGSTPVCMYSAKVAVDNHFDPYFCTPIVDPSSSTEAGLFPKRFTEGEVTATYDLVYEYLADAASSFYDFRHQITEPWHIKMTDPIGASTLLVDLPVLGATSGELDRSKPNVLQHVAGSVLYDPTSATGIVITLPA